MCCLIPGAFRNHVSAMTYTRSRTTQCKWSQKSTICDPVGEAGRRDIVLSRLSPARLCLIPVIIVIVIHRGMPDIPTLDSTPSGLFGLFCISPSLDHSHVLRVDSANLYQKIIDL